MTFAEMFVDDAEPLRNPDQGAGTSVLERPETKESVFIPSIVFNCNLLAFPAITLISSPKPKSYIFLKPLL